MQNTTTDRSAKKQSQIDRQQEMFTRALAIWGNLVILLILLLSACAPIAHPTTLQPVVSQSAQSTVIPTTISMLPPLPRAEPTPGSNWLRPADGMLMVDVPAGNFNMGSNDGSDAEPVHTVYLDEYWIDQTEVTNGMFEKCVIAGACQPPILSSSSFRSSYFGNSQFADYPVIYISWNDASAYCVWMGSRLPSEAEWEKAARGTDERTYPWGDTPPSCSLANYQGCANDTVAVGSYPAGASPYGALDMAGNVWEFVNDWYGETYYSQSPVSNPQGPTSGDGNYVVLRGGSWNVSKTFLRSAYRLDDGPGNQYPVFGFRCSRSLP
jgi:formylglycine-generating enzyme required for sulfatase activity